MTLGTTTIGGLVPLPDSPDVGVRSAEELVGAVRALVGRVTAPGLSEGERLARAGSAGDALRDLADVGAWLDPYRTGQHSRAVDMLTAAAGSPQLGLRAGVRYSVDGGEARRRLALAEQFDAYQARAVTDLPQIGHPLTGGSPPPLAALWLNDTRFVTRAVDPLGRGRRFPEAWSALPVAFIDPAAGTDVTVKGTLAGTTTNWHVAAAAVAESQQLLDFTVGGAREVETLLQLVVDVGLEKALVADLTAVAVTAATFKAAEVAVGAAWSTGPDLVLCAGADRPKVLRSYATEYLDPADRPRVYGSAGLTAGTALVMASAGVAVEASAPQWMLAQRPSTLGQDVALLRYGAARLRLAGAVQKVTVT